MNGNWLDFPTWLRQRGRDSLGPRDTYGQPIPVEIASAPFRADGASPAGSQIAIYQRNGVIPTANLGTQLLQVIPPGYYDTLILTARTTSLVGASQILLRGQFANLGGSEGVQSYTFPTNPDDAFCDDVQRGGGTPTIAVTRVLELPLSNSPVAVYGLGSFNTGSGYYVSVTAMTTRR